MMHAALMRSIATYLILAVAVAVAWMEGTGRTSIEDLKAPLNYSGDAYGVLAQTKAYAAGEIVPLLPKEVASLGAPFGANWTDYPAEDFVYFAAGLVSRVLGLFTGTTIFVMGLHVLAALAFFATGRALSYRRSVTFACALLFALAPYGFVRSLPHLTLTAYWHVPFALFSIAWAAGVVASRPTGWSARAQRNLAVAGAVAAGLLNPYYLAVFLWLAACVLAGSLAARERRNARATASLLALAAVSFLIQSLDSVWMNIAHGRNVEAVTRSFGGLDVWGLRLPDLAFPIVHRSETFQKWADATYQNVAPGGRGRGEAMTAYIGLIGFASLIALFASSTIRIAGRQFPLVSAWFWMALATFGLGVVGGINYFLGALGFLMLRATNRFSIVLLAIALLWLCEFLSCRTRAGGTVLIAALLIGIGLWDQLPPPGLVAPAQATRAIAEADARFTAALESALPKGAMVLQLPIKKFPETGPIHQMEDYEHFRPYLHSKALRFSYGTLKGRGDADWQAELALLPVPELAARAAGYGFSAIYVNRKAYPDRAQDLEGKLRAQLGEPIANSPELVAYRLPAVATPKLPRALPRVTYRAFSSLETNGAHSWTWATSQDASLVVARPYRPGPPSTESYAIEFGVATGFGGAVRVSLDGRSQPPITAVETGRWLRFALPAGVDRWTIDFHSENPPQSPNNGDPRLLTFRIEDVRVVDADAPAGH